MRLLKRYKTYILPSFIFLMLLWGSAIITQVELHTLFAGIPRGVNLLLSMFPPDLSVMPELLYPALETVQIAFVGTVLGICIALFVGMFAASNVNKNRILREITRGLLSAERALPDLIVLLFFVTIVGLGAFPGVMGLAFSSLGMLGKLFADAIEEIDPRPSEAIAAVGATRLQIIRFAILPQVWPSLIANSLFRFEINIRASIFLGVVGAGGIGFNLIMHMRQLEYQQAMSAILVILFMVVICERISDVLRKRIIGAEVLK